WQRVGVGHPDWKTVPLLSRKGSLLSELNPCANLNQSPHAAVNYCPAHATFHIHVQFSVFAQVLEVEISEPGYSSFSSVIFTPPETCESKSPRNQRIKKQRPKGCLTLSQLIPSSGLDSFAFIPALVLDCLPGRDVGNRNSEVVRPEKTEAQRGK
ncbi:hypothetical protein Nmel_005991, partial [Mimus melanotis]